MKMKNKIRKSIPVLLAALMLGAGMAAGCRSEETMFRNKQNSKGATIKSNIKMKGSNKTNGHTTRSY